ncbi:MAG TPA: helix-turn-helix domain-containing protein [Candidatus Aphodovivens avistercoris]|nr:helix-turn-helix domain-containing protein [Candidatus Aphodovivens avistercoris]
MERTEATLLAAMAAAAGLPRKPLYTISEVADATGVPRTSLAEAARSGELRTFMPPGRKKGTLVRCEWFDDWFARGTSGGKEEE